MSIKIKFLELRKPDFQFLDQTSNIFAQLIDDVNGKTLASASTIDKALKLI